MCFVYSLISHGLNLQHTILFYHVMYIDGSFFLISDTLTQSDHARRITSQISIQHAISSTTS